MPSSERGREQIAIVFFHVWVHPSIQPSDSFGMITRRPLINGLVIWYASAANQKLRRDWSHL